MDVFWCNEGSSLLTQRNLKAMGTADCLQKQVLDICMQEQHVKRIRISERFKITITVTITIL